MTCISLRPPTREPFPPPLLGDLSASVPNHKIFDNRKELKTMTTAKLYEFRAELECALGLLEKNADNYYSALSLSRLIEKVNAEITAADAKSTGRTSTLAAVKRILKTSAASDNRDNLKFASIQNGYQYFCDGFRLVALNDPLPGFPEMPDYLSPPEYAKLTGSPVDPVTLVLPDLGELKNWIKRKTAAHKASGSKSKLTLEYSFGENLPTVNAAWLVDMLEALPGASAVAHRGHPIRGILLTAENGHGLLMPIRKTSDCERTNLAA